MTSLNKVEAAAGSALVLLALVIQPARAAEYRAPRNEYGQPDLRGVWNFSSDVPLERPKELADKSYRTREDLDKANAARDATLERMTQTAGTVGAHNTFWLDYRMERNVQLLDFECVEFVEELTYGKYRKQPAEAKQ